MKTEDYNWMDNPTVSGVSPCCTDTLNDCLMHLKYENKPNLCPKGTINSTPTGKLLSFSDNIVTIAANTRTLANGEMRTIDETSFDVEQTKYKSIIPKMTSNTLPTGYKVEQTSFFPGYSAFSAYDKTKSTFAAGASRVFPYTNQIILPEEKKPEYAIFSAGNFVPFSFEIFGSNDRGAAKTVLYTYKGGVEANKNLYIKLDIDKPYTTFGITISANVVGTEAHVAELDFFESDPNGDICLVETQLIGINGNNQPFTTDSIYTQGNLFPENPIEGQYHLINDPTKFGMWRFVEEVWTQENGVADIVFCGEVLLKDGFIEEVKDFLFNSNGFNYNASIISGFSMPSGKYIDLPTVPSGSSFTAPANGYYYISSAGGSVMLGNITTGMASNGVVIVNFTGGNAWVPVRKGDKVRINYNSSLLSNRFIYAQGEKND